MGQAMVRINVHTHQTLREIAQTEHLSMQAVLEKAVEEYRRRRLLEEANAAYAVLRSDPEAWQEIEAERAEWEALSRSPGRRMPQPIPAAPVAVALPPNDNDSFKYMLATDGGAAPSRTTEGPKPAMETVRRKSSATFPVAQALNSSPSKEDS